MHQAEIIVLLFAVVAVLAVVACKIALPYPIVLVIGGLAVSFVPRLPEVKLNPDIVFYFFLPALLYPAALFTSWRDFRRNLRQILFLAIGLVLVTMVNDCVDRARDCAGASVGGCFCAWAQSFRRQMRSPLPRSFAGSAFPIVSKQFSRERASSNDATALVALQFAVAALMTGTFSLGLCRSSFCLGSGWRELHSACSLGVVMRWVQSHLDDPPVQITISLLTPFVAYLPAERLHASGVLATVAAGIFIGWHSPFIVTPAFRLQAFAFWEMVVFLLNGFIFIVIGLQLAWNPAMH